MCSSDLPRREQPRESQHVIGMPMRHGEPGGREHVGAKRELQSLARVDEKLKGPVPQPVGVHRTAETTQVVSHLIRIVLRPADTADVASHYGFCV